MSSTPTLIFIPGSGHIAEIWDKIITLLSPQYKCIAITLESAKNDNTKGLDDDVAALRSIIIAETSQGHDAVLVAHSFGGAVAQSSVKGLTRSSSTSSSPPHNQGHIIGLALMASGFGQTGISFIDCLGGSPPPTWRIDDSGFAIWNVDPIPLFYHDLPEEERQCWAGKMTKLSLKSVMEGGEFAYAGWKDVPAWFLATTDDRALPVEAQRYFVQFARDNGGDVTLREIGSSHSPMLSRPEETAAFIREAVEAFVG